jgi:hypothetical protein
MPHVLQNKKQDRKKLAYLTLRKSINITLNIMALTDKVPITKFEKWITRIIAAALAAWEAIKAIVDIFKDVA